MSDNPLFDLASDVLDCARNALNATPNGAPPRAYVTVGEAAWDDCCDGQLTVAVNRAYPSTAFPDVDDRKLVCGPPFTAAVLDIEIVRCWPSPDTAMRPPTAATIMVAAEGLELDARAIWKGVLCCLWQRRMELDAIVNEQISVGPSGGCAAKRLSVTVGLVDGCPCP